MKNMHAERAVDYYSRNFNCTQGVFTTYAIEHGIDEKVFESGKDERTRGRGIATVLRTIHNLVDRRQ